MTEKTYQQILAAQIKVLIEKVLIEKAAKEARVVKGSGKKLQPFERIKLKGKDPTTPEIIAEGRR